MGKLYDNLQKQLKTEYKKEAEDCIKLYNKLKEINNGHVWESHWRALTMPIMIRPDGKTFGYIGYNLNAIGEALLKGIS